MTELEAESEKIHVCSTCPALWVDVAILNRLLLHNGLPGLESLGGRVVPDGARGVCRNCGIDLTRIETGPRAELRHYETCESCGGVFVDNELEVDVDTFAVGQKALLQSFRSFSAKKAPSRG
jgi:Zn-finger nucleic acid-binding protein